MKILILTIIVIWVTTEIITYFIEKRIDKVDDHGRKIE
jgi:hypothetical protein